MKITTILSLVIIVVLLLTGYIYFFQKTLYEGFSLFEEQCTKVDPLINDRDNKLNNISNLFSSDSTPSAEGLAQASDQFIQSLESYTLVQEQWLPKAKQFLDNWRFNLLMPGYMKHAAQNEYQMYYEDYLSSASIQQASLESDINKQLAIDKKIGGEMKKRDNAKNNYLSSWESDGKIQFWLFYFLTVPESQCDAGNTPNPFVPPMLPQLPIW